MCPLYGGRLWFKCSCGTWKKCSLYGVSALERFCYKGFFRNLSRTKIFVCLSEVSALGRFYCTMFITNNHDLFRLRWKENFIKHQKVSKYYGQDCNFFSISSDGTISQIFGPKKEILSAPLYTEFAKGTVNLERWCKLKFDIALGNGTTFKISLDMCHLKLWRFLWERTLYCV